MKNNLLLFLFLLLLIVSCNDNVEICSELTLETNQSIIPIEDVYDFASTTNPSIFLTEELNSNKSLQSLDFSVEIIRNAQSDTLYYVINYGANEGYILLDAAANADFPILAFNDTGKFCSDNIESLPISKVENDTAVFTWSEVGLPMLSLVESQSFNKSGKGDAKLEKYVMPNVGKKYKWGQGAGYNNDAPNKASIGCPAIAIGLLCMHNRFPHKFEYDQVPTEIIGDDGTKSNTLSKMLKEIADSIPNYIWGKTKDALSGAEDSDIIVGLHKMGFSKAENGEVNISTIISDIQKNQAVLLTGEHKYDYDSHIWFCDGVTQFVCTRKEDNSDKEIVTAPRMLKLRTYLYFNMGNNGKNDGWYYTQNWGEFSYKQRMFTNLTY